MVIDIGKGISISTEGTEEIIRSCHLVKRRVEHYTQAQLTKHCIYENILLGLRSEGRFAKALMAGQFPFEYYVQSI